MPHHPRRSQDLKFTTQNVQGLNTISQPRDDCLRTIALTMRRENQLVVCLQETWEWGTHDPLPVQIPAHDKHTDGGRPDDTTRVQTLSDTTAGGDRGGRCSQNVV